MSGWFWFIVVAFAVFLVMELGGLYFYGVQATLTDYIRASTKRQPIMILFIGIALGVLFVHFWGGASGWCG
jgi:hypothetical protein